MEAFIVFVLAMFVISPVFIAPAVCHLKRMKQHTPPMYVSPYTPPTKRQIRTKQEREWEQAFNDETPCDCRPFDVCIHTEDS